MTDNQTVLAFYQKFGGTSLCNTPRGISCRGKAGARRRRRWETIGEWIESERTKKPKQMDDPEGAGGAGIIAWCFTQSTLPMRSLEPPTITRWRIVGPKYGTRTEQPKKPTVSTSLTVEREPGCLKISGSLHLCIEFSIRFSAELQSGDCLKQSQTIF